VYFISARELDLVKIGYAFNPLRRYNHLRTFSPVELTLEGAIPGGYDKERALHKRFATSRVRGEWFKLSPNLQREIDASSRPQQFTRVAVRAWIKKLANADAELERRAIPPEVIERIDRELAESLARAAARSRMSYLERREADGDIHFPFREMEGVQ
jgi:hypothetical protein